MGKPIFFVDVYLELWLFYFECLNICIGLEAMVAFDLLLVEKGVPAMQSEVSVHVRREAEPFQLSERKCNVNIGSCQMCC